MSLTNSIDEFLKEQAQPTPEKIINQTPTTLTIDSFKVDDFEAPEIEEEEEETDLDQPHEPIISVDPAKEARTAVTMIDMTQKLLFTGLLKAKTVKKIGGKDNWNTGVELADDVEFGLKKLKDLTPEETRNFTLVERTKKKIARLALTNEEKDIWNDALRDLIAENGYKMPPSALLIIAAINTLVPRLTDLLID